MSKAVELEPPLCGFCGEPIVDDEQVCPACDDGRCCYQALAYYHTHEEELDAIRTRRERETAAIRCEIEADRPDSVTPL